MQMQNAGLQKGRSAEEVRTENALVDSLVQWELWGGGHFFKTRSVLILKHTQSHTFALQIAQTSWTPSPSFKNNQNHKRHSPVLNNHSQFES